MTKQRFFTIGTVGLGQLFTGPRPQSDDLADWALEAKMLGIDRVVSLIEESEVEKYNLWEEGSTLAAQGIELVRFPIDDFDVPDLHPFHALVSDLFTDLNRGCSIMLHCAGGIGRAGTTASCLLVENGASPDAAMTLVSTARGETCPETSEQVSFVRNWNRLN